MKLIIIESPFAGKIARNIAYAREALLDCLKRGEAPLASHLLYPQVLDDALPEDRSLGIEAGFVWMRHADGVAFYTDFGWSEGMKAAKERAMRYNLMIHERTLRNASTNH